MKYILVIGDGMADDPVEELGGKTPLEAADKPFIDELARKGVLGAAKNCPAGFPVGSETAIMSLFGCSPKLYYTGRAPIEAAAQGIALVPGDAAYRCNMVCYEDAAVPMMEKRILSHSAGSIEAEDSNALVTDLFAHPDFAPLAEKAGMSVTPGSSFRHIAVQHNADIQGLKLIPPHDHLKEVIGPLMPSGCENAKVLTELMVKAHEILNHHPINERRRAEGKMPANGIWFWAEGTAAQLPSFPERYGHGGGVVSAVPLCHGIAQLVGLQPVHVAGATGEWDTNYENKVAAGLKLLEKDDFLAIHLEGPDEATHNHDLPHKLDCIRDLSARVVRPIHDAMRERGEDFRMLIVSDHRTIMKTGAHGAAPVPFILYDSRVEEGSGLSYTEENGLKGPFVEDGVNLMSMLFDI
ncbi:MAG: 2,3-bisphosphoglycerate-independent phosphoglycerate mutase [Oscillospiraceae bacterium]|nr:2,3-bisphosphoglycerate-independent phosphoglycerate mutase [Oscillospiraceae bacterium]